VHNSLQFIERTADSVLQQTFTEWEWLLVDDASTDGSSDYLRDLGSDDSRVKVIRLTDNMGAGPARNRAIEQANGRFVAFLDSDDIWIPCRLEMHVGFMEQRGSAFSHTSYGYIDEHDNVIRNTFHVSAHPIAYTDLLKRTEISCLTAIYDQNVLGKMYMPDLRRKQDYALWLAILKRGYRSDPLDVETAFYRQHSGSATNKKHELILKHWQFLRDVEGLSPAHSLYYTTRWGLEGLKKYYLPT